MANTKANLPQGFLLEITQFSGSSDSVCLKAIEHYKKYLNHPDPIVAQIAKAMVGNLTEYYNISHPGSYQFELALPHLSNVANFMDSKNTPSMDIQSTARIKSFYSTYEKLLIECSKKLEKHEPIPTSGLAKDIIATRDVLSPRYQFKNNPQAFYKQTYKAILEFMDYIDGLSQYNPNYGFEEVEEYRIVEMEKIRKIIIAPDEDFSIPERDFVSYALEIKKIPEIYRNLVTLDPNMSSSELLESIYNVQHTESLEDIDHLPIAKLFKAQIKKQTLIDFRNELEEEFVDSMDANSGMYKDYTTKSRKDFLYINKPLLKPEYRDYLSIIDAIDSATKNGDTSINFSGLLSSNPTSAQILKEKLELVGFNQEILYHSAIDAIKALDLDDFETNYEGTKKILHYAACSKDYMRFPKESGYQSFHISVKTPFGFYEKQFRTEQQHIHAEYGSASHSKTYKPYEKENFHRLKVPTPLMPARDETGEIITPILLTPLDFAEAIREYYHKDFEYFSGVSMDTFKLLYPEKENYDQAIFELSQSSGSMLKRLEKKFAFLTNWVRKKSPTSLDSTNPFDNR